MNNMTNSDIKIDESNLAPAPTIMQRLKNTLLGIILGAVFVQLYFFYGAVKSGSFVTGSIIIYFDSYYFLGYLAICGALGWFAGQDFLDWMKVKMNMLKFW